MEIILDSDSSDVDEEGDLIATLRKRISSLEEENKLLKRNKAQGEKTHMTEVESLQKEVNALTRELSDSKAKIDIKNQQLTVELKKERLSVLQFEANTNEIHNALLSLPKLLPRVERALLTGRSDLVQGMASNRNVQPVDSKERDLVAAVPAAVLSSDHSVKGLPTAAVKDSDVDITKPLFKKYASDKVAVVKEEVDDNMGGTPPSESLVPQDWLRFSNKIKLLRVNLGIDPFLVLRHKNYSSELLDLAQGTSTEYNKYFVPKSAVTAALRSSENYYRYTLALFEVVFDYEVALHCKCGGTYLEESSVDTLLATLPEGPLDAFLSHCVLVAKSQFKANASSDRQLRLNLARCINVQLRTVRSLTGLGPSPTEFEAYTLAMRRARKRKLPV